MTTRAPVLILGTTDKARSKPYALRGKQVHGHRVIVGISGQGKSVFLLCLAIQLWNQGIACSIIDPHGDLTVAALSLLHEMGYFDDERAYERLHYIDFSGSTKRYPAFNVLSQPYDDHTVARDFFTALTRAMGIDASSAPQMSNVILAVTLALVQAGAPITKFSTFLLDETYREQVMQQVTDPHLIEYMRYNFEGREARGLIESSLRRINLLTYTPILRYSLGQQGNILRLRELMDRGVSLLLNISGLDEESQRLLGSLLTVGFERAALSRVDVPDSRRTKHHLIVDEYSMFSANSSEALARVLDQTRKFGLYLSGMAFQTYSQLDARMRGALQNAAVEISFRLGHDDAATAGPRMLQYNPALLKHDPLHLSSRPSYASQSEQQRMMTGRIRALKPRQAVVRADGKTTEITTLHMPQVSPGPEVAEIIRRYAEQLLTPQEQLEGLVSASSGSQAGPAQGQEALIKLPDRRRSRVDLTSDKIDATATN